MATEETLCSNDNGLRSNSRPKSCLFQRSTRREESAPPKSAPGPGGDEAAFLPERCFACYSKYAEIKGFKVDVVEATEMGVGGYKGVVALLKARAPTAVQVRGRGPPGAACPSHRGQWTDYTSTVTVAVMPEVMRWIYTIDPMDLRSNLLFIRCEPERSIRQKSAVRITHIRPVWVSCQDERFS